MKKILFILLIVIIPLTMNAQIRLFEEEVKIDTKVTFTNYTGEVTDPDTVDEIYGIGKYLSSGMEENVSSLAGGKYEVRRYLSTNQSLLSADVFVIGPTARVDHIKNIKRMIAGYLMSAFEYKKHDAMAVASFVAFYNAFNRGNGDILSKRYAPEVSAGVSPEKIGLARHYKQWPGQSELLIPIAVSDLYGRGLGSREMYDSTVDQLREEADRGIDEREAMLDVRRQELAEQQRKLNEEREQTRSRQEKIEGDIEAISQQDPSGQRQEMLDAAEEKKVEADQEMSDLDAESTRLGEERAAVEEDQALLDQDKGELSYGDSDDYKNMYYLKRGTAGSDGLISKELNVVDKARLELLRRKDGVMSRNIGLLSGSVILVTADSSGIPRLTKLDGDTLDIESRAVEAVYPGTHIAVADEQVYAVILKGKKHIIGVFDSELKLLTTTSSVVAPGCDISADADHVYVTVQTKKEKSVGVFKKGSLEPVKVLGSSSF